MSQWRKIIISGSNAELARLVTGPAVVTDSYKSISYTTNSNNQIVNWAPGNSGGEGAGVYIGNDDGTVNSFNSTLSDNDVNALFNNSYTPNGNIGNGVFDTNERFLYITLPPTTPWNIRKVEVDLANNTSYHPQTSPWLLEWSPQKPGTVGQTWYSLTYTSTGTDPTYTWQRTSASRTGIQTKFWRLKFTADPSNETQDLFLPTEISFYTAATVTGTISPDWILGVSGSTHIQERLKVGSNISVDGDDGPGTIVSWGSGETGNIVIQTDNNLNNAGISFRNSGGAYTHRIYRTDKGNNSNEADLIIAGGAASQTITTLNDYVVIRGGDAEFQSNDIGKSPGDINLIGDVSSSATSTASFGTYLGDGSQLTNLPGSGVEAYGFDFSNNVEPFYIDHSLDSEDISVTCYTGSIANGDKRQIIPREVRVIDTGRIQLEFDRPTTGRIVLHRGGNIVSGSAFSYRQVLGSEQLLGAPHPDYSYEITHNLGETYPIVQFYTSSIDGYPTQMIPRAVTSINENVIRLEFDTPMDGTIVVKR